MTADFQDRMVSAAEESFDARVRRLQRTWRTLAKRASAWCGGNGHRMGPLHAKHADQRLHDPRVATCQRCHMNAWVRVSGELSGYPSYHACPVVTGGRP